MWSVGEVVQEAWGDLAMALVVGAIFGAFFIGFAVGLPLSGEGREWLSLGVVALLTAVLTGIGIVWLARDGKTAVAV